MTAITARIATSAIMPFMKMIDDFFDCKVLAFVCISSPKYSVIGKSQRKCAGNVSFIYKYERTDRENL